MEGGASARGAAGRALTIAGRIRGSISAVRMGIDRDLRAVRVKTQQADKVRTPGYTRGRSRLRLTRAQESGVLLVWLMPSPGPDSRGGAMKEDRR